MPLILIDNYDSFTYNLYQMIQALTEIPVKVFRNDAITLDEIWAMKPQGIILSPGPGHPKNDKDFGVCREILNAPKAHSVTLLGVCLGHQGMVLNSGGTVGSAPAIVHGKSSPVDILEPTCPLLKGLPNPFQAMRYHSLVVAEDDQFPRDAYQVVAKDQDHQLIMAVAHTEYPWYGVQFHPESIGTPEGSTLLQNFVDICKSHAPPPQKLKAV